MTTAPGVVDVFWTGTDAALWHAWRSGGWNGPERLGFDPLGGAPVAVGQPGGTIDEFWKGTDAAVWHAWFSGSWRGPERLGGAVG